VGGTGCDRSGASYFTRARSRQRGLEVPRLRAQLIPARRRSSWAEADDREGTPRNARLRARVLYGVPVLWMMIPSRCTSPSKGDGIFM